MKLFGFFLKEKFRKKENPHEKVWLGYYLWDLKKLIEWNYYYYSQDKPPLNQQKPLPDNKVLSGVFRFLHTKRD